MMGPELNVKLKDQVQAAVNDIYSEHGEVKASTLVESARPKTSPIHAAFEWDNKKAGSEYRLMQARQWIRRVEIIVEDRPERFVHIPTIAEGDDDYPASREGYYKPISVVMLNYSEYERALDSVKGRLAAARKSYAELKITADEQPPDSVALPDFKKSDRGFALLETALG